jgi:hypothetical protein
MILKEKRMDLSKTADLPGFIDLVKQEAGNVKPPQNSVVTTQQVLQVDERFVCGSHRCSYGKNFYGVHLVCPLKNTKEFWVGVWFATPEEPHLYLWFGAGTQTKLNNMFNVKRNSASSWNIWEYDPAQPGTTVFEKYNEEAWIRMRDKYSSLFFTNTTSQAVQDSTLRDALQEVVNNL